jgi:hypothetical protein
MSLEATKVWLKLQQKIPMPFSEPTSLGDLVKYIQASTVNKEDSPDGIPIYLDPIGLQDADKTIADTITMNLKGVPLATTLKLAVTQLSLMYRIHPDGFLFITSTASEESREEFDTRLLNEISTLRRQMGMLTREMRILRGAALRPDPAAPGQPSDASPSRGAMGGGFR